LTESLRIGHTGRAASLYDLLEQCGRFLEERRVTAFAKFRVERLEQGSRFVAPVLTVPRARGRHRRAKLIEARLLGPRKVDRIAKQRLSLDPVSRSEQDLQRLTPYSKRPSRTSGSSRSTRLKMETDESPVRSLTWH